MNELIKITEKDGVKLVSARELHRFLEVKERFNDWIKRMIESYGFEEGTDFYCFFSKTPTGRPTTEYGVSMDMAKELSMVQRNEKGKMARKYFIEKEKENRMPMTLAEWRDIAVKKEQEVELLKIELDQSKDYASVKRVQKMGYLSDQNPKNLWRPLKTYSVNNSLSMPYVSDVNYEQVRTYHKDAWMAVYAIDINPILNPKFLIN